MKKILPHLPILFFALIIIFATLSIPQTVYNHNDMRNMKFGYPIAFITQDVSHYDPPFPWKYSFSSPWENPTKFNLANFLSSYLIIFLFIELIVTGVKKSYFKT